MIDIDEQKKIAVLIDADNTPGKKLKPILQEIAVHGHIITKRAYGDFTIQTLKNWKDDLNNNAVIPVQQFAYTQGKNSSDSAMIIDAMDILYSGKVDGFCIVSSDSDFTSLARRLAESGMIVIGMGESDKATAALENAYDKFVYIDVLAKQAEEEAAAEARALAEEKKKAAAKKASDRKDAQAGNTPSKRTLEERIKQIIMENDDKGKATDLGQIGNELSRMFRNFDVRYYDKKGGGKYKYLKEFVGDFKSFELVRDQDSRVFVELKKK